MTKATDPRNTSAASEPVEWKYGDRYHDTKHLDASELGDEIHQELIRAQDLQLPEDCTFVVIASDRKVCVEVHNLDPVHLDYDFGDGPMALAIFKAAVQAHVARFDWTKPHRTLGNERRFRTSVHLVEYDEPIYCQLCEQWHPTFQDDSDDRTDTEHTG